MTQYQWWVRLSTLVFVGMLGFWVYVDDWTGFWTFLVLYPPLAVVGAYYMFPSRKRDPDAGEGQ